jgi:hypothetical protein
MEKITMEVKRGEKKEKEIGKTRILYYLLTTL